MMLRFWKIPCLILLGLILPFAARAQVQSLWVQLEDGREFIWPVDRLHGKWYLSLGHLEELLLVLEPDLVSHLDEAEGIFQANAENFRLSLFQNQNHLLFNHSLIQTPASTVKRNGDFFVPLATLKTLFDKLRLPKHNLSEMLGQDEASQLPATQDKEEASLFLPGERARNLLLRRVILLDPQPAPSRIQDGGDAQLSRPEADSLSGPDLTRELARRVQDMAAIRLGMECVLTHEPDAPNSLEERVRLINTTPARALVCLRLDNSAFTDASGFRLFYAHSGLDPKSGAYGNDDAQPLPLAFQFMPWQDYSLDLCRQMETELLRAGLLAATPRIQPAPFYLLRRAPMPALSVSLGYRSNPEDRARLTDNRFISMTAAAIVQALANFEQQLQSREGISLP